MFTLAFERNRRVLLVRFYDVFWSGDIDQCDDAIRRLVREEGPMNCIVDLSDVTAIAVPETRWAERARLPPISQGRMRVMVAPQLRTYEMARDFTERQRNLGDVEPIVVRSLSEACERLGLATPIFEPVYYRAD